MKLIQDEITYEFKMIVSVFRYNQVIKKLKNEYKIANINSMWSIKNPFKINIAFVYKIKKDIDIHKIREAKINRRNYGTD